MKQFRRHFLFIYIFVGCLAMMVGCATVTETGFSKVSLQELCEKYHIRWERDEVTQVVTLQKGKFKAMALIGSPSVIVGDEEIFLSQPLRMDKKAILVPVDFQQKVINRFIETQIAARPRSFAVVIDAGHGGKDPGAIGGGMEEKKIVLDIAQKLYKILEDKGMRGILTREGDQFVSLNTRTEIASRTRPDLFLSIHANSSPSKRADGIEVWAMRPLEPGEEKEAQRQQNKKILFDVLAMKRGDPVIEQVVSDMLYSFQLSESRKAAQIVSRELGRGLNVRNRGVKHSGFFVLRNNLVPAILVEVGFLSNASEAKLLKTRSYRQKIAALLAEGILSYVTNR